MIHLHVIITAVVLLIGAFAALLICLCVDIVPIIKSRGSTLASRDSTTREQARKLKKSLQESRLKAIQDKESDLGSTGDLKSKETDQLNSVSNIAATKVTSTTTTTTVVVEASPFREEPVINCCLAVPDGDNSAQGSSTGNSSVTKPQISSRRISEETSRESSEGEVQNSYTDRCTSTVSVFSSEPTCCEGANAQRPCCSQGYNVEPRQTRLKHGQRHPSRKKLAMVSNSGRPAQVSAVQSNSPSRHTCHTQSSTRICSNYHNVNPSPSNSSDAYVSSTDHCCSTDSERGISPSSYDYHDAPWDMPYKDMRGAPVCRCCCLEQESATYREKNADERMQVKVPLLEGDSKQYTSQEECHRHKRHSKPHHTKQHRVHGKPCSYLPHSITSSLHGTGGSSPHSSLSSSPSSLSSSSHSGQRCRRTKLEDIQEASGWSEEENTHQNLKEIEPYGNQTTAIKDARDQQDSPLHSCASSVNTVVGQADSTQTESTKPDKNTDISENQRLKLSRNFVLDMKAAIEGAVIDVPTCSMAKN
ncbi:uncharacterized protein LOC108950293 [Ciona intestinalis]